MQIDHAILLSINLQGFLFTLKYEPLSRAVITCHEWAPFTYPVVPPNAILSSAIYFSQATKCFLKCSVDVCLYSPFFLYRIPFPLPPALLLESLHCAFKTCSLSDSYYLPRVSPFSEVPSYQQILHYSYFTRLLPCSPMPKKTKNCV